MEQSAFFNWVDYAIIGIILLSVLISLVRGFVREALSLITWIVAIWVSIHFASLVSQYVKPYISALPIRMAVSFFILFFLTLLVGSLISFILAKFIHKTGLSGTDRSLGVVFGLGRGVVIVAVGLLILTMMFPVGNFNHLNDAQSANVLQQSRLAVHFKPLMDWLKGFLPESSDSEKLINFPKMSE